jgi:hypothetical protein
VARLRRDAGDRLQALCGFVGPRIRADVCGQSLDLLLRVDQLIGEQVQSLARWRGPIGPVTCRDQALDVVNPLGGVPKARLRRDDAELAQMRARHAEGVLSARRVHDLGLLTDQKLPRLMRHQQRLRVLALHGEKPHRGAGHRIANRFRIGLVIRREIAGPSTISDPPHCRA